MLNISKNPKHIVQVSPEQALTDLGKTKQRRKVRVGGHQRDK